MANGLGNLVNAIADTPTRMTVLGLGRELTRLDRTVSTLSRNRQIQTSHADLLDLDYANAGHTGFASSAALSAHINDVANIHAVTLQQAIAAGATASSEPTFNGGIDLGSSGRIDSNVVNAAGAVSFELQPSVALTSGTDRWLARIRDQGGNTRLSIASNGAISMFSEGASAGGALYVAGSLPSTMNYGIFFAPTWAGAGVTALGIANSATGGWFGPLDSASCTATTLVGGTFTNDSVVNRAHTNIIGGLFAPVGSVFTAGAVAHGTISGWMVRQIPTAKTSTATAARGGYIPDLFSGATPVTPLSQGLIIDEQTRGSTTNNGLLLNQSGAAYKALAIRDQTTYFLSRAAGVLGVTATTFEVNAALFHTGATAGFYNVGPIARPTNAGAAAAFVANTSGIADDSATFDGYTLGQIAKALRNLGLLT